MQREPGTTFAKSLLSSSTGTLVAIVINFLTITLIVKAVPKETFGFYILALAMVNGLRIIGGLGLDLTLVKFLTQAGGAAASGAVFSTILLLRLGVLAALAVIASLATVLFGGLLKAEISAYLGAIIAMFVLMSLSELCYHLLQGLQLFHRYALVQVLFAVGKLSLVGGFVLLEQLSLETLFLVELSALGFALLLHLLALPKAWLRQLRLRAVGQQEMLRFGLPLYLNSLLTFIYERADIFIMAMLLSPISLAYYDVAAKIPEGMQRLFRSFINVYFPRLSSLFAAGRLREAGVVMNRSLFYLAYGCLFLALGALLFGGEIIGLIFSSQYLEAAPAFSLLMINFAIMIASYTMGYSLVSAGHSSVPVKVNVVSSIVSVSANLLLIPKLGFTGAACSLMLMNSLGFCLHAGFLMRAGIVPQFRNVLLPALLFLVLAGTHLLLGATSLAVKLSILLLYLAMGPGLFKDLRSQLMRVLAHARHRLQPAKSTL